MFKYDVGDTVYYIRGFRGIMFPSGIIPARVINYSEKNLTYALKNDGCEIVFKHYKDVFKTKKVAKIMYTEMKKKFKKEIKDG